MITPKETINGLHVLKREVNAWYDKQIAACSEGVAGDIARERFERGRRAKLEILNDAIAVAQEYDG